jgi:hypothetical protein
MNNQTLIGKKVKVNDVPNIDKDTVGEITDYYSDTVVVKFNNPLVTANVWNENWRLVE